MIPSLDSFSLRSNPSWLMQIILPTRFKSLSLFGVNIIFDFLPTSNIPLSAINLFGLDSVCF